MKRLTSVKKYLHQFNCDYKNYHLNKPEWVVQEVIKRYKDSENYVAFKHIEGIMIIEILSDSPILTEEEVKAKNNLLESYFTRKEEVYQQIIDNIKEIKLIL